MSTSHVLIVEDKREVRRMLRAGVLSLGEDFKVTDVISGEEALLEVRLQQIDLLVTDVRLPGMSGLELMNKLRLEQPDFKVVLLTGVADPAMREEIAEAGADAFFFKPVEMADFLDTIERILGLVPEGILPAIDEEKEAPEKRGVSNHLTNLRQELDAISAILLNDQGRILIQAGDLPDTGIESNLIPSLMAAFSASQKISHYLGKSTPESLFVFSGSAYDLLFSNVGKSYAVLIVAHSGAGYENINKIASVTKKTVRDLEATLADMGIPLEEPTEDRPPPPLVPAEVEQATPTGELELDTGLEALFDKPAAKKVQTDELDDFWEPSTEQSNAGPLVNTDALTYDQALQLGIVPPEDEDSEA